MAADGAALVVIDVQQAFDDPGWGARNNRDAEANVGRLLRRWRLEKGPVIHVRHLNEGSGGRFSADGPGFAPKPEARELAGEPVLTKTVNSAFIGTDLQARLDQIRPQRVLFVGLTTDHCVSTTVRMAANLGYHAVVVSDATATFERTGPDGRHWSAQDMHDSALASLSGEFADVVSTGQVLGQASEPGG